jgi:predicted amidophosphoribosyltransferase
MTPAEDLCAACKADWVHYGSVLPMCEECTLRKAVENSANGIPSPTGE